jgi:diaminohydroxyphosphoribosylaminopyrimidine deaminase/5-amino-6-(5-phosphoribosylamino)uracil reductase
MVGAVVVEDGVVLAKGYHSCFGGNHAEVDVLNKCSGLDLSKAILYVSLEPCCNFGKTPPCTEAIVNSGLKHVVVGCLDPNKDVSGKGVLFLERNGLRVEVLNYDPAVELNKKYNKFALNGVPYVTIKVATTIDGCIADKDGMSKYLTNSRSREHVMKMRAGHDAVLVGLNTLNMDDPHLGVRGVEARKDPLRILLSSSFCYNGNENRPFFRDSNFVICKNVEEVLEYCKENLISSILVEGGSGVISSFIKNNLFDELVVFTTNGLLGGEHQSIVNGINVNSINDISRLNLVEVKVFDNDVMIRYSVN